MAGVSIPAPAVQDELRVFPQRFQRVCRKISQDAQSDARQAARIRPERDGGTHSPCSALSVASLTAIATWVWVRRTLLSNGVKQPSSKVLHTL
jgi:hypothetical protein